jgi:hypothetical protein
MDDESMVALVLGSVWSRSAESSAAFPGPTTGPWQRVRRGYAIIAIVDAGRKDFTPCVLAEKPDNPGSRHAPTWLFEAQENDTAPEIL